MRQARRPELRGGLARQRGGVTEDERRKHRRLVGGQESRAAAAKPVRTRCAAR